MHHPSVHSEKDVVLCHCSHIARALQRYRTWDIKGSYTTPVFWEPLEDTKLTRGVASSWPGDSIEEWRITASPRAW